MSHADVKLDLARKHLKRVQSAWDAPTDWDDLFMYGFYCLEAAVEAAAAHRAIEIKKTHWAKADAADELHSKHGLPSVSGLLGTLNDGRKAVAYGDVTMPDFDAEELAGEIEFYVDAVAYVVGSGEQT